MPGGIHELTVDNITTTNTLEVWRDKLQREKRWVVPRWLLRRPLSQSPRARS